MRDGAAVLYAGGQIAPPSSPQTVMRKNQQRNKAKTVRRIYRKMQGAPVQKKRVCVASTGDVATTLNDEVVDGASLLGDRRPTRLTGEASRGRDAHDAPGAHPPDPQGARVAPAADFVSRRDPSVHPNPLGARAARLRDAALARGHGAARAFSKDRERLRAGDEGDPGR